MNIKAFILSDLLSMGSPFLWASLAQMIQSGKKHIRSLKNVFQLQLPTSRGQKYTLQFMCKIPGPNKNKNTSTHVNVYIPIVAPNMQKSRFKYYTYAKYLLPKLRILYPTSIALLLWWVHPNDQRKRVYGRIARHGRGLKGHGTRGSISGE